MNQRSNHCYTFGSFHLDASERRLLRDGEAVPLPPKAFDLLLALVKHHGQLLGKNDLLRLVWPDMYVEEGNLSYNVSLIRKALGETGDEQRYIETVPKHGYRFIASVKEMQAESIAPIVALPHISPDPAEADIRETSDDAFLAAIRTSKVATPVSRIERRAIVIGIFAFLLFALAGVWLYLLFKPEKKVESLVILPFANESADLQAEYLSDGITESLINNLSRLSDLRVIARATAFRYKGKEVAPTEIGQKLNVSVILMGKVVLHDDTLIVQVDLVDTASGTQLWGERYTRKLSDILTLQDEITRQISEQLRPKLSTVEQKRLTKHYTENTEAYQLYIKGNYFWNKATEDGLRKGIEYFNQAVEKDPTYALAYTGLADSYTVIGSTYLPPKEVMPKAKAYAVQALKLDETLGEAHAALGWINIFYDWDWLAAEKEAKRALELNPNHALAHTLYGDCLEVSGRTNEAIAVIKRGLELDPLSLLLNADLGWSYYMTRQYEQAIEQFRKTLEMDPNFFLAYLGIGQAYEQKRMYKAAIAELNKARTLSGGWPLVVGELGYAYAASGQRIEAKRILQGLREQAAREYVDPAVIAFIYVGLGEKDQAFTWLEKACEERSTRMPHLKVEPKFDPLRTDPRFADLLRRIGLAP